MQVYCATKVFEKYWAKSLTEEVRENNIDVLTMFPFYVSTQMTNSLTGFGVASAKSYVSSALKALGNTSEASGTFIHELEAGLVGFFLNIMWYSKRLLQMSETACKCHTDKMNALAKVKKQ